MGLSATRMVLQRITTNNAKNLKRISDETFEFWSRRAVGGTNPINSDVLKELTRPQTPQISLWQRIKNIFGFRKKVNPKTFASGEKTPNIPFVASKKSVEVSNRYVQNHRIGTSERIVDGFRDGGRDVRFDKWGKAISAHREIVTVDIACDKYLQKVIEHTKASTQGMSEKQKAKFIYDLIIDLGGDAVKAEKRSNELARVYQGQEILLGKVFEKEASCCRHKSLLFKILADEIGLKTRMIRGNMLDFGGIGGHAWNEVILSNGKRFIYDTQNASIINVTKGQVGKNASCYLDMYDQFLYK